MAKKNQALWEQVTSTYDRCMPMVNDNEPRRQDSWLFYRCEKPYNITVGEDEHGNLVDKNGEIDQCTEYVVPVLRTAVNQITYAIVSTFTSDDSKAVFFRDWSFRTDPLVEKAINEQVNQIILQMNNGKAVVKAAFKEAAVTGTTYGKAAIESEITRDKVTTDGWEDLQKLMAKAAEQHWDVDLPEDFPDGPKGSTSGFDWKTVNAPVQDPQTGEEIGKAPTVMVNGTLRLIREDKRPITKHVSAKDIVVDTTCGSNWDELQYICQRHSTTVGEALKMGFSKKDLMSASDIDETTETYQSNRNLVSNNQISNDEFWTGNTGSDPMQRPIRLYEHYIYSSLPSGKTKLYQVWGTRTVQLDYKEVPFIPFVKGEIAPIADSFWGESLFDYCKDLQVIKSDLIRVAKQNVIDSTFQKVKAVKGKYDRDSLMNSHRTGAIIEMTDNPDYVQQWIHQDLPQSYTILNEQLNGHEQGLIGALVGGQINPEDGLNQVAASTVAQIMNQEGLKTKTLANEFADSFVRPLYQLVYRMMVEEGITIKLEDGRMINSKDFPSVYEFATDINTPNDLTAKNSVLMNMLQMWTSIQGSDAIKFKIADEALQQVGCRAGDYFPDPAKAQPDPEQILAQQAQKELHLQQIQNIAADTAYKVSQTAHEKVKMQELIKTEEVERTIKLTESSIQNQIASNKHLSEAAKLSVTHQKNVADTALEVGKLQLDKHAVDLEAAHDAADITVKHATLHANKYNGIRT